MNTSNNTYGYVYLSGQSLFDMKKTLENFVSIMGDISSLFDDFVPEIIISQGLNPALENLCNVVETNYKIKIDLNFAGDDKRLAQDDEILIYQIVQELIVNVINHAKASELVIDLNKCENRVFLKVKDNGIGVENQNMLLKTDGGLNKIRAKLADKDGWLSISGNPGKGAEVSSEINF